MFLYSYIVKNITITQNQDKMKTKLKNIALEGTHSGDVVGGFYLGNRGNPSGAFVFSERGLNIDRGIKKTGCPSTPTQGQP
jgi:hypothetical protein